jgi:hypothetical protein
MVNNDEHDLRAVDPLRLRDVLRIFVAPRTLFAKVEDTGAYGWALLTLLVLVMLIGVAKVQTGLIDQSVDARTEVALSTLEKSRTDLIDRIEMRDRMNDIREAGVFQKTIQRIAVIGAAPAYFVAAFLLISSVIYALVAMTGRKPEFHTLMSICVHAGFIPLVGAGVGLAMMLYYRTDELDTSLGMLGQDQMAAVLGAIDPFRIWFWVLVAIGLVATRQLSRRMAIATCTVMALLAMGVRVAIGMAPMMG